NIKAAYALERARQNGIEAISLSKKDYDSSEAFDEKLIAILAEHRSDLIVLAGYLRILTPKLIAAYKNRILNIHPSLLPAFGGDGFYGMRVHEAVYAAGVKVSGATVHFVDEGIDSGLIVLQKAIPLGEHWLPEEIQAAVLKVEHELLPEAVKLFCERSIEIKGNRVTTGGKG
ncbi:MAG TPA: phosphoribosylglycinamide formyltransferase, partial [Bellilinea sp.]|nr:phosphoribosylglycinamide formyltransferase [Bellilinea sp.]